MGAGLPNHGERLGGEAIPKMIHWWLIRLAWSSIGACAGWIFCAMMTMSSGDRFSEGYNVGFGAGALSERKFKEIADKSKERWV